MRKNQKFLNNIKKNEQEYLGQEMHMYNHEQGGAFPLLIPGLLALGRVLGSAVASSLATAVVKKVSGSGLYNKKEQRPANLHEHLMWLQHYHNTH